MNLARQMTEQNDFGPDISHWLALGGKDKPALVFEDGRSWTYQELDSWAARLSGHLAETYGIVHGDRVCFLGHNDPVMIALFFACARLGTILVPMNWRLAAEEIR